MYSLCGEEPMDTSKPDDADFVEPPGEVWVAQTELICNLFDRFKIGLQDRVFKIVLADKTAGVDINRA